MQIDSFIDSYCELKELSLEGEFKDTVNPLDGVSYPNLLVDIPEHIKAEILEKIEELSGLKPLNETMFMRMSPKGVRCPHKVHHDWLMGDYSLMLYLNDNEGGTALVKHNETGISYAPQSQTFSSIKQADKNDPSKWERIQSVKMKQNRAFIFDARQMHCAEPIGGFGESQQESRIVLTCFFSTNK